MNKYSTRVVFLDGIIEIWHSNIKYICTLDLDIALSCTSCNMNFQSANKFDIVLTGMPYLYDTNQEYSGQ